MILLRKYESRTNYEGDIKYSKINIPTTEKGLKREFLEMKSAEGRVWS